MLENKWAREYLKGVLESNGNTLEELQALVADVNLADMDDPLLEIEALRQGGSAAKCFKMSIAGLAQCNENVPLALIAELIETVEESNAKALMFKQQLPRLQKAAAKDPKNGEKQAKLGFAFSALDDWESALSAYTKALEHPDTLCFQCHRDCLVNIGWEHYIKAEYEESLGWFEMASRIQEPKRDDGKHLEDSEIKFLTDEQALTLQSINGLRDAAQHHLIDISEEQLYIHAQSGVTLFGDILKTVFNQNLTDRLPARVLPISTMAPVDLQTLFEKETKEIQKLLGPRTRRQTEGHARLRPLAILDATIRGEKLQPSAGELRDKGKELMGGKSWEDVFPGAASISLTRSDGGGHRHAVGLRITKKGGIPVELVPEGTPGASVVAIKRVDELGFFNLGRDQLAEHLKLSGTKATAAIWCFDIQNDSECFKEVIFGKTSFKRYSQRAIEKIQKGLETKPIELVWDEYKKAKLKRKR